MYIKGLHGLGLLGLVWFLFVSIFKLAFLNVSVCVGSHLSLCTTNLDHLYRCVLKKSSQNQRTGVKCGIFRIGQSPYVSLS